MKFPISTGLQPISFKTRIMLSLTGVGHIGADQLNLIAGAQNCIGIAENSSAPEVGFYGTTPTPLLTSVAVSAAGIHAALVTLGLITGP